MITTKAFRDEIYREAIKEIETSEVERFGCILLLNISYDKTKHLHSTERIDIRKEIKSIYEDTFCPSKQHRDTCWVSYHYMFAKTELQRNKIRIRLFNALISGKQQEIRKAQNLIRSLHGLPELPEQ